MSDIDWEYLDAHPNEIAVDDYIAGMLARELAHALANPNQYTVFPEAEWPTGPFNHSHWDPEHGAYGPFFTIKEDYWQEDYFNPRHVSYTTFSDGWIYTPNIDIGFCWFCDTKGVPEDPDHFGLCDPCRTVLYRQQMEIIDAFDLNPDAVKKGS